MALGRRTLLLLPFFVFAILVAIVPTVALGDHDSNNVFNARIVGINEVPAINTGFSGTVRLVLFADHIDFTLNYSGADSTVIQAHIHIGQTAVNGAVSAFYCGPAGGPAKVTCPGGPNGTVTGTITAADVLNVPAQGVAAFDLAGLEKMIRAGVTYSNVHTVNHPGGEIRDQNRTRDD
jgi:hypothetical protein